MRPSEPIYVETRIRTTMDALWACTQDPAQHRRWDLRFTRIGYLPRTQEEEPQRFLYATRIGFGLEVRGERESVGEQEAPDGSRTSALRSWSDDPRSLIAHGSGYWRYVPNGDAIRFLTRYDYRPRFGGAGKALDEGFERLDPRIQARFGFSSADAVAQIGRGTMDEIWRGPAFTVPFLAFGTWRRIMFPTRGSYVPFTVENYAYVDSFGRETVSWIRTFDLPRRTRRFDASMIWSERRGCRGTFLVEAIACDPDDVPAHVRPRREEPRE